jgi:hypothetical protein
MEQHATLIMGDLLQAGQMQVRKRVRYERLDEQLQELVSSFDSVHIDVYFIRARALFNF